MGTPFIARKKPRRRFCRLAWSAPVLGALLAFDGCAVGPDFQKPDTPPVPQSWRPRPETNFEAQTPANALWWKSFGDPTLDRLVELAYHQNLNLQVAGLRIIESRALLGIATGNQYPQFQQLSAGVTAQGVNSASPLTTVFGRNFATYNLGLDAAWELDFWGKYRRGVEAQANQLLASVADYDSALVSLSAEVARTYVLVRTYEALIDLAKQNEKVQSDGLNIAEARFKNGATSELDVSQATTILESTRATIPPLQAGLEQARNALNTLLGQPVGTVDQLLVDTKGIPKAPEKVAVAVPAEMLRRRPDVRSAELNAASQCALIGVAKADLYPSFSLAGSIGFQTATTGPATRNLFSGDNLIYQVGPRISWPFLNYGRLQNAVRVQDARFEQLLVNYRNTVLRAVQEVEDALSAFVGAQQAIVFSQRSVIAAQRSVEIAIVQYREGSADFQRVLDAERSLLEQQNSLAQNSASVANSLIALYKALGGGWELRGDQPVVSESTQKEMEQRTSWGGLVGTPREQEKQESPPPPEKR